MFIGCMGLCESANGIGYLVILIGLVCVFQFGWASAQISHLAMIPELTHVESERDELNIIRYILRYYSYKRCVQYQFYK
jgi:Na+/melibiose symporter-like transporter